MDVSFFISYRLKKKSRLYDHFDILTLTRHFQGQGHQISEKTDRTFVAHGQVYHLLKFQKAIINSLGGDSFGPKSEKFLKKSIGGAGPAPNWYIDKNRSYFCSPMSDVTPIKISFAYHQ